MEHWRGDLPTLRSCQHPSPPTLKVLSRVRLSAAAAHQAPLSTWAFSGKKTSGLPFLPPHHDAPPPPKKTLVALRRKSFKNHCPSRTTGLFGVPLGAVFPITKDGKKRSREGVVSFIPAPSIPPLPTLCASGFVKNPSNLGKAFPLQ